MGTFRTDDYNDLKLPLEGYLKAGEQLHRNVLFDQLYSSLPRDPQVKVQIYNAEIALGGFTNWHLHNGRLKKCCPISWRRAGMILKR